MRIQLPDFIIADLYKNSLVATGDIEKIFTATPEPKITKLSAAIKEEIETTQLKNGYLGNNAKHILLLIKDDSNVYLNNKLLNFLIEILAACELDLNDVAIVDYGQHASTYEQLKEKLHPQYCFLFNVNTLDVHLPFTIPCYQVQQFDNCTFLLAPSLQIINGSTKKAKVEKTKLWMCLKNIFNV